MLIDTGAAAVLGALGDPAVAEAAAGEGASLVNVGNTRAFARLVNGRRLDGQDERAPPSPAVAARMAVAGCRHG